MSKILEQFENEVQEINKEFKEGAYDEEMRDDLIQDLIELTEITAAAQSLDTKITIDKLVVIAKAIAGGIK